MADSKIAEVEAKIGMSRKEFIRKHPQMTNVELAGEFGVHVNTVSKWMLQLGLEKTAVVRKRVQHG